MSTSDDESDIEYEVQEILGHKVVRGKNLYRIKWKGFTSDYDSWEPEESLGDCMDILSEYKNKNQLGTLKARLRQPPPPPEPSKQSRKSPRVLSRPAPAKSHLQPINGFENHLSEVTNKSTRSSTHLQVRASSRSQKNVVTPIDIMKEVQGRYPTIDEMRKYAVHRSRAKVFGEDVDELHSDGVDHEFSNKPTLAPAAMWSVRSVVGCVCFLALVAGIAWTAWVWTPIDAH